MTISDEVDYQVTGKGAASAKNPDMEEEDRSSYKDGKAMKVDWNQTVAGIALPQIRDILRHVGRYAFDEIDIAQRMRVGRYDFPSAEDRARQDQKALQILQVLAASRLIESRSSEDGYRLNANGRALCAADMLPRMTRKAADKAVNKLKRKVCEINSDPIYMHDIAELCLFGSYIENAEDLGDIDVGYTLGCRWDPDIKGDFEAREKALDEEFPPPNSLDSFSFWAETLVRRRLRVNRRINLTPMSQVERLGCPRQMIHPQAEMIDAKPGWKDERITVRIVHDNGEALERLREAEDS